MGIFLRFLNGEERLEIGNQRAWTVTSFCLVPFMSLYVSSYFSSLLGFISSLPQLAWDKRLCCCCCSEWTLFCSHLPVMFIAHMCFLFVRVGWLPALAGLVKSFKEVASFKFSFQWIGERKQSRNGVQLVSLVMSIITNLKPGPSLSWLLHAFLAGVGKRTTLLVIPYFKRGKTQLACRLQLICLVHERAQITNYCSLLYVNVLIRLHLLIATSIKDMQLLRKWKSRWAVEKDLSKTSLSLACRVNSLNDSSSTSPESYSRNKQTWNK
jgi:hypothetical protein